MSGRYIPALGWNWLTPLYDPFLKWGLKEEIFKSRLIELAGLAPGQKVLDLGCGTGTLTLMVKQQYPEIHLVGLDGDTRVLAIARIKAAQAHRDIEWRHGMAFDLPYPEHTFDRVLSSLMVHHLSLENKRRTFREVWRVLKPGGGFYILDIGVPKSWLMRGFSAFIRNFEETRENVDGRLPGLLQEAGFVAVADVGNQATLIGPLSFYQALKA